MISVFIRPATLDDIPGIARVHLAVQKDAYQGIFPAHLLENVNIQHLEQRKRENLAKDACTFVAETDQGEIIGYASGGPVRGDVPETGELYNIFVLPDFQNQGLGNALFLQVVEHLSQAGYTSLQLWVIKGITATRYYEYLGGQKISSRTENVANVSLVLVCYSWPSIKSLETIFRESRRNRPAIYQNRKQ